MTLHASLLGLVRQLSRSPSERCALAHALAALIRYRALQLAVLRPLLVPCAGHRHPKLQLWGLIAWGMGGGVVVLSEPQRHTFRQMLGATVAYGEAKRRQQLSLSSPFARGQNYYQLLDQWRRQLPERVFLFHHFDRRGLMPRCWLEALTAIQAAGWNVVVSSSGVAPKVALALQEAGLTLALRQNLGLCLGAYRDLSLLLLHQPDVAAGLRSLVLANDSTLPVLPPAQLLEQLDRWRNAEESSGQAVLAGLTDSAQRACYHLQSYFLYANAALLRHPAWRRFWLGFSIAGSKDELINGGEIGLSQALLAADISLRPAYPLVPGLLDDPAIAKELRRFGIGLPCGVNPSLFTWQSLLARGFPLVKKHVLFDLVEAQGQPMPLAALARWIPAERRELLAADLQELFVSRYSGGEAQMG
jgi:hypothetical protein